MTQSDDKAIELELDRLRAIASADLRREWRLLYCADAPRISRDLLVLGLAHKLQADKSGDLGKAIKRKLRTMAKSLRESGRVGSTQSLSLKPGSRLMREWHGQMHIVTVTADGFEHNGSTYASLTTIAKHITGTHRSGPRFFGLLDKATKGPSVDPDA